MFCPVLLIHYSISLEINILHAHVLQFFAFVASKQICMLCKTGFDVFHHCAAIQACRDESRDRESCWMSTFFPLGDTLNSWLSLKSSLDLNFKSRELQSLSSQNKEDISKANVSKTQHHTPKHSSWLKSTLEKDYELNFSLTCHCWSNGWRPNKKKLIR